MRVADVAYAYRHGVLVADLARELGVTRRTVYRRLEAAGVARREVGVAEGRCYPRVCMSAVLCPDTLTLGEWRKAQA